MEKRVKRAVRAAVPTAVGVLVEQVKDREERLERGSGLKDVAAGVAGDRVEHVDEVKEDKSASRRGIVAEVSFELGMGEVDNEVNAAGNFVPVLAVRGKESGDCWSHDADSKGGSDAAEGRANANGAEFVEVIRVFVESDKVLAGKMRDDRAGEGAVDYVVDKCVKMVEVRVSIGAWRGVKGVGA